MGNNPDITHKNVYCDFCGKSQHELDVIIKGPKADICNECVLLSLEIMVGNKGRGRHLNLESGDPVKRDR